MAAVVVALLIGICIGLLARPVVDVYIRWKTAQLYADPPAAEVDDHDDVLRDRRL